MSTPKPITVLRRQGRAILEIIYLRGPESEDRAITMDSLAELETSGSLKETCKQNHTSSTESQKDLFQKTRQEKSVTGTLPGLSLRPLQCIRKSPAVALEMYPGQPCPFQLRRIGAL